MVSGGLRGKTYQQAQCRFGIKPFAVGDGRVRLEMVPEIHYGQVRQRWIGDQRAFRLDAGQDEVSFDELTIDTMLAPGQTLIVASTPDAKGLGGHFFTDKIDEKLQKRLLLIRVAQTQLDDRFTSSVQTSPVAGPSR